MTNRVVKDLISVIIPVYNVEDYIEECLDSVVYQTYKKIEIIIVNDGSTDDSLEIIKEYKKEHSNIKIINQRNAGQSVARNKGIEIAKGEYIYFLDSDDFIALDMLNVLMKVFRNTNVDLIRFPANTFLDNINMEIDENKYNFNKYFFENRIYEKNDFLKITNKAFTASPVLYIIKSNVLMEKNIRFFPNIIHEDDLFTIEVFLNIRSATYIAESFYKRRYRKGSTMTTNTFQQSINSFKSKCIILRELYRMLDKHNQKSEITLIKTRITRTIEFLARNYPEIKNESKIKEIKKLQPPYIVFRYYYHYIKGVIANMVHKILDKLK